MIGFYEFELGLYTVQRHSSNSFNLVPGLYCLINLECVFDEQEKRAKIYPVYSPTFNPTGEEKVGRGRYRYNNIAVIGDIRAH